MTVGFRRPRLSGARAKEEVYSVGFNDLSNSAKSEHSLGHGRQPTQVKSQALDLLAKELRQVRNDLSAITGEFTSDELLGVIFPKFCIGK
jgi:tRNA U34 5-carboxymethylaminomethyl modifying GTPase MnmE/TrmE